MIGIIVQNILIGFDLGIRIVTMTLSILLIVRSVMGSFLPISLQVYMQPLIIITDIVIIPVRYFLPERLVRRRKDYSPLVAALLILLIGLGIENIIGMAG